MKLITFSGIDGSGKSTQRQMLESYLQQQGKKVYSFHVIEFSLANKIHGLFRENTSLGSTTSEAKTTSSFLGIFLRKIFLLIDLLRFRLYARRMSCSYEYLLSDRYFFDTLVNLAYLAKKSAVHSRLEQFIPRPDAALYFQVDPDHIMSRERVPEQGRDYLEVKKRLFEQQPLSEYFIPIDGSKSPELVFHALLLELQKRSLL